MKVIGPIKIIMTFDNIDYFINYYQQHKDEFESLSIYKLNKMFKIFNDELLTTTIKKKVN